MRTAREEESSEECDDISHREEWIWERSPPCVRTDECCEYMSNEGEEWSPYPCTECPVSTHEIEEILREDESKYDKECEWYDVPLWESEVSTDEPDWPEVLRGFFEEWCEEEYNYRRSNPRDDTNSLSEEIHYRENYDEYDCMDSCDFLQEDSREPRTQECEEEYDGGEEDKIPHEKPHLEYHSPILIEEKYICQSDTNTPQK